MTNGDVQIAKDTPKSRLCGANDNLQKAQQGMQGKRRSSTLVNDIF
jgi:hypothetical protein